MNDSGVKGELMLVRDMEASGSEAVVAASAEEVLPENILPENDPLVEKPFNVEAEIATSVVPASPISRDIRRSTTPGMRPLKKSGGGDTQTISKQESASTESAPKADPVVRHPERTNTDSAKRGSVWTHFTVAALVVVVLLAIGVGFSTGWFKENSSMNSGASTSNILRETPTAITDQYGSEIAPIAAGLIAAETDEKLLSKADQANVEELERLIRVQQAQIDELGRLLSGKADQSEHLRLQAELDAANQRLGELELKVGKTATSVTQIKGSLRKLRQNFKDAEEVVAPVIELPFKHENGETTYGDPTVVPKGATPVTTSVPAEVGESLLRRKGKRKELDAPPAEQQP